MSADLKESSAPLAEISQGPNAFEEFLDRNQKAIVLLVIAVALGGVALVIYRGIQTSRQESAGAALTKAEDLAGYQAVVKEHPDTIAAGSAMVLLANSQWTAGKQDDAIGTLQKFVSNHPGHPALPSAKANLASKLMTQGKSGDAAKLFEEIAADSSARFIAPFALVSLGDLSRDSGNLEKAEASYNQVKTDFPDSSFSETANRRLAILKAKPPVEIAPPVTLPTPPATGSAELPAIPPPSESVIPSLETPALEAPEGLPLPDPVTPKP